MSELENQPEGYEEPVQLDEDYEETEELAEDESPADLAPDSEPEHEQNAEDNQSDRVQEVINTKHRRMKEAEERAARAEQQLQQMQQQYKPQAPTVPAEPDPFDEDYDDKIRIREDAIRARALYDAQQQQLDIQNQQRQQALLVQQQQETAKKAQEYQARAKKLGIKPETLVEKANVVGSYFNMNNPAHNELVNEIITDEQGPLITKHLAENISELAELSEMPLVKAVLHIERNIKPKLAKVPPKQTRATRPSSRAKNSGSAGGLKYAAGGSFE